MKRATVHFRNTLVDAPLHAHVLARSSITNTTAAFGCRPKLTGLPRGGTRERRALKCSWLVICVYQRCGPLPIGEEVMQLLSKLRPEAPILLAHTVSCYTRRCYMRLNIELSPGRTSISCVRGDWADGGNRFVEVTVSRLTRQNCAALFRVRSVSLNRRQWACTLFWQRSDTLDPDARAPLLRMHS